jgi:ATP/maltotriose-dependent transcriptional regulator MalT
MMDTVAQLAERTKPNPTRPGASPHRPESPRLVVTKMLPPPVRDQTVARDRLVDELRAGSDAKVTLLAAPAGYGKTTLLAMWGELEEATKPVAWLTVDEGQNEPAVFWSYLVAALRRACPRLGTSLSPELVDSSRIVDTLLPELVNELAGAGDVALVLDDFHRLTSREVRETVAWLIAKAPSTFQLVLATRSEPALPLAALRAHSQLRELRAEQLAFTLEEAETLLNECLDLEMEREYVEDLVERTEGWPAGLYLAALSLRGAEDRNGFASRFGAENRHVVDFLVDEVLDAHEPDMQMLMLRCAALERLNGRLCDAVLEQEGSETLLDSLARTNLFLVPLDDQGEWYRFHHLFAQLLRVELENREPGLVPLLHRRAYAWHREHGTVGEAIEHALEAGAFGEAGELLATVWVEYALVHRYATVLAWLARFPVEAKRDPVLLAVEAWLHALSGEREAAAAAIAAVEELGRLDAGPLPDGFSSLEASLATLRGLFGWGDVGAALEHARRAAELEGPESSWRPVVAFAVGSTLYSSGELDEADRWLAESAKVSPSRERKLTAAVALAYRSLAAGERGAVDEQAALAEQAVQLFDERATGEGDGEVFIALGASLEARGELEEALPLLERGIAQVRAQGRPLALALGLIRHAGVLRATGRDEAAAEAITQARTTIDACRDPGMVAERLAALEESPRSERRGGEAPLTDRELVILRALGGPLTEREIGRELYLSHHTIHSHTRSIYRKLGVSSRSEALTQARRQGVF